MVRRLQIVASLFALAACSSVAWAGPVPASPPADFHVYATEDTYYKNTTPLENTTINDEGACAATSIINSFQYLEQRYPDIYAGKLIPSGSTAAQARDALHDMIHDATDGLQGDVWNAKLQWLHDNAPGTTSVSAITLAGTGMVANPKPPPATVPDQGAAYTDKKDVTFNANGSSMWDWMKQQIKDGEDVEIGLYQHMMTLIGVACGPDGGEAIEYIDPNAPTLDQWGVLDTSNSGYLSLTITGSGYGPPTTDMPKGANASPIYYAMAESPVPEPTVMAGMAGLGVSGLVFYGRRRRTLKRSIV